ncbi:MAG: tetratricopeptide repeat protein, partial [Acetobacteraceae bacterium]|nr:tetratricopeptide repeat protein [Acetobacteraceae bacterium]
ISAGRRAQAREVMEVVVLQDPDNPEFQYYLGNVAFAEKRYDEAQICYGKAIDLKPDLARAYNNLGNTLNWQQKFGDAETVLRKAIDLDPGMVAAHNNLGVSLREQRKYDQAIIVLQKAIDLKPDGSAGYDNLGNTLNDMHKYGAAEAAYRKAIDLKPDGASAYSNLGGALIGQQKYAEAETVLRKAIDLKPDFANAYRNLGTALVSLKRYPEAEAVSRKAIDLDPGSGKAYFDLGRALESMQKYREAEAAYRKAIDSDPSWAAAHGNLGNALHDQRKYDEAEAAYRNAIDLDPDLQIQAYYYYAPLGDVLMLQARFDEAAAALKKAGDLLPADSPRHAWARQWERQCRRYVILDARLPAILRGTEQPANAGERMELAMLCEYKKQYAAVARFSRDAFTAEPKRAEAVPEGARYDAARAAALAGCGQGKDAGTLDDRERALWRRQALDWLRQDLAWWRKELDKGDAQTIAQVGRTMRHWEDDDDLVGVRARDALTRLPDEERGQWERLWADVAALVAADPLGQGRTHAAHRQWGAAADCYARALERGPTDDGHFWFEYAALLLLSGDRPGYVRACAHMIEGRGKVGGPRAYHVARVCTLAPDAVSDVDLPRRLAEKELQASAGAFWSLTEQGALHYRAGRFQDAAALFEQSLRADPMPGKAVLNWLWLALAQQRLGNPEQARRWLDKVTAWLDLYRDGLPDRAEAEVGLHLHNWLEAHVLRREAEATVRPAEPR